MDPIIAPSQSQVVAVTTAPRPTPTPYRVRFSDVLAAGAGGLVQGAEAAMQSLPGSSTMAVALRGGALPLPVGPGGGHGMLRGAMSSMSSSALSAIPSPISMTTRSGSASMSPPAAALANPGGSSAEGPGGSGAIAAPGATSGASDGGMESSLAQSQEMNMYYLQIQEQVNSQNRTYSALSNIIKAEHDTVKNAIGNLR